MKLLPVVAAALVNPRREVLVAQRASHKHMGGLWEFPGGKIEANEVPEVALIRELREELGIIVAPEALQPLTFASHTYTSAGDDAAFKPFHLILLLYVIHDWQGIPLAREHSALAWVLPEKLTDYAMPPADMPLVRALIAPASPSSAPCVPAAGR